MGPTETQSSGALSWANKGKKRKSTARIEPLCIPDEVVLLIMACLPFKSLVLFRTVSKTWNAMLLNPLFQRIRASLLSKSLQLEFLTHVMQSAQFYHYRFERSENNLMIMSNCHDMRVVRSSDFTVKQLSPLDCTLSVRKLDISVLDVLLKKGPNDFVVFALSVVSPVLEGSTSEWQELSGPLAHQTAANLHRYDSTTDVWTLCGKGLNLSKTWREMCGFALHRGRYMALARTWSSLPRMGVRIDYKYDIFCYNQAADTWETLPGETLPFKKVGASIFDHGNTLYVGVPSFTGCWLWKYDDAKQEWAVVRYFRAPVHIDTVHNQGTWKFLNPYAHLFGDHLHFGEFAPPSGVSRRRCRLLTYNLITGLVEDMCCDHAPRLVSTRPKYDIHVASPAPYPKSRMIKLLRL